MVDAILPISGAARVYPHNWLFLEEAKSALTTDAKLQNIIVDDVPLLPMAETGSAYLQHPQLQSTARSVLGANPDYTFVRVVNKKVEK